MKPCLSVIEILHKKTVNNKNKWNNPEICQRAIGKNVPWIIIVSNDDKTISYLIFLKIQICFLKKSIQKSSENILKQSIVLCPLSITTRYWSNRILDEYPNGITFNITKVGRHSRKKMIPNYSKDNLINCLHCSPIISFYHGSRLYICISCRLKGFEPYYTPKNTLCLRQNKHNLYAFKIVYCYKTRSRHSIIDDFYKIRLCLNTIFILLVSCRFQIRGVYFWFCNYNQTCL